MTRLSQEKTLLNAVTPTVISGSTNANPSVVTSTAHGLTTGDRVLIQGHLVNTAINGIFKVVVLTVNTFTLKDEFSGDDIAANGVGGATGFCMLAPVIFFSRDYKVIKFTLTTQNNAYFSARFTASDAKLVEDSTPPRNGTPNFGAAITKTNPYSYVQAVNYDDGSMINGSDGILVNGDVCNMYEANTNGINHITLLPVDWVRGAITLKAIGYDG